MADVNANIGINIDTSKSLAEIKNLQRQLAQLYTSINRGSAAAAAAQKGLATNLMNTINAGGKFYAQMGTIRTSTESFTHALEKNKLTMREYFRFAGGSTRTFGRLFKSEFDTIGRVAEERVKKMQTQYVKLGRDASGAMRAMSITPTALNMQDYGNKVAVAAQKQALLNQLLRQGSTNLLNFGKNTQWSGRQLMVGFTIPLAYFGTAAAKTFMDLEAQALRFRRVYGDMFTTTAETNKALADIEALAKQFTQYGVAVSKTMEMAASAAAMGRTGAELTAQVAQATRLAVLGNVEQEEALRTTISLTDAFGLAAQDLTGKINFLNAVENQTITAIEDLTIAIPKAGPVVKQLGGSVEDLAFFLTAMREGGINASEGANALKSGLASLINPTEKAAAMLANMGINIKAIVEGNVGNLRQTVIDFSRALDTLAPLERSRAIEQLFGKFQFARLSTLFENVTKDGGQAARVLDLAGKSVEELAILAERELGAIEDSVATDFKEAIEEFKLTIAPIGKEFLKAITPVVKFLGELFERFGNLSDGTKKFIVVLTTLVGLLGPVLLMTFGLLANGAANIIKMFLLMRQGFLKLSGNSTNLAQQTSYLNTEQMEAAVVAASLNQAHTRLTQQFTLEASAVNQLRNAYIQATAAAARFAAANPGMMIPGAGKIPKKFASGTMKVPGYAKGTDSVPAMLTPGEAVIPEPIAQDDRFKPLIAALVSGEIRRYQDGTVFAHAVDKRVVRGLDVPQNIKLAGFGAANAYTTIGFDIDGAANSKLNFNQMRIDDYRQQISNPLATQTMVGKLMAEGIPPKDAYRITEKIRTNLLKSLEKIPSGTMIGDRDIYSRMGNTKTGILGGIFKDARGGVFGTAIQKLYQPVVFSPKGKPKAVMNGTAPIQDVINAVKKTRTSQSVLKAFNNLKSVDPNLRIPVQVDSSGNILAYQRPEVSKTTGKITDTKNIGVLQGDRFVTGRIDRGGGRGITKTIPKKFRSLATQVIMGRGEILQTKDGKQTIVTGQTGTAKKPGTVMIGGGPSDTRAVPATKVRSVIPRGFRGAPMFGFGAQDGHPPTSSIKAPGLTAAEIAAQHRVSKEAIEATKKETKARKENTKEQGKQTQSSRNLTEAQRQALSDRAKAQPRDPVTGRFVKATVAPAVDPKADRMARIQRASTFSGPVAMAAGTAAMVAAMSGADQKITNMLFGISAVAGLLPLLMNPIGAVVAGLLALGSVFLLANKQFKDMVKGQSEFVKATSATTDKMRQVSEITNTTSSSQAMRMMREGGIFGAYNDVQRAGTQFGDTFLESDIGKKMATGFADNMKQFGSEQAAKDFALQLAAYISDGVLTAAQASSIAEQIGVEFGSQKYTFGIKGELDSLIGFNGEDLLKDPLTIRAKIVEEASQRSEALVFDNKPPVNLRNSGYLKDAAKLAAFSSNNLQTALAQADATQFNYEKQIQLLEKEMQQTNNLQKQEEIREKISKLQGDMRTDMTKMNALVTNQLNTEMKRFKLVQTNKSSFNVGLLGQNEAAAKREAAYFDSLKQQVTDVYAGTQFSSMAKDAQARLSKLSDRREFGKSGFKSQVEAQDFEVRMNFLLANKVINPEQNNVLMEMFAGKLPALATTLDIGFKKQGAAETVAFLDMFAGFKNNKARAVKMAVSFIKGDPKQFTEVGEAIATLQALSGKELNIETVIFGSLEGDFKGIGEEGLKKLAADLATIEELPSPITKDSILRFFSEGKGAGIAGTSQENLELLMSKWKDFDALPDVAQKEAISKFTTLYQTIFADEESRRAYFKDKAQKMGLRGRGAAQYITGAMAKSAEEQAVKETFTYIGPNGELISSKNVPGGGEAGGGRKAQPTDNLLRRLKFIADARINETGGISELDRITKGKGITRFKGITQQLLTGIGKGSMGGFNREFISALEEMDKKTRAKFIKIGKNGKVILKDAGKDLKAALNEKAIREFSVAQLESTQNTKAQGAALAKLKAAGVDSATALEIVADANLAVAINAKNITSEELVKMAEDAKTAKDEMEKLNLEVLNLAEGLKKDIGSAVKTNQALLAARGAGILDPEMLEYISKTPSLVNNILDQGIGSATAQGIMSSVNAMKSLGDQTRALINPAEAALESFKKLKDASFKVLDLRQRQAQAKFNTGMKRTVDSFVSLSQVVKDKFKGISLRDAIKSAEGDVDAVNNKISVIQDTQIKPIEIQIQAKERSIDDIMKALRSQAEGVKKGFKLPKAAYEDIAKQLKDEIDDLELEIEFEFKRKIDELQEESSDLSNDLTLMDRVIDGINKKYDKQAEALEKVASANQEILDQQRSQLDVASALTSGDIAAAARAVQEARAQAAARAQERAGKALDVARAAEIGDVRSASGMTREQIEQRQFEIGQRIYQLEEQSEVKQRIIRDIKDEIDAGERAREAFIRESVLPIEREIEGLQAKKQDHVDSIAKLEAQILAIQNEILGPLQAEADILQKEYDNAIDLINQEKDHWEDELTHLEAATAETTEFATEADKVKKAFDAALEIYKQIKDKTVTITVNYAYGSGGGGGGGDGDGLGSSTLAGNSVVTGTRVVDGRTVVTGTTNSAASTASAINPFVVTGTRVVDGRTVITGTQNRTLDPAFIRRNARMYGGKIRTMMGGGRVKPIYRPMGGLIPYMNNGGFRSRGSDTVPAMLTPGEFVINKASTKAFTPFLTAINESKYPSILANKISDARPIYQIPIQTSLNQPSYNISTPMFNASPTSIANASYSDNSSAVYNYNVGISVGGTSASPDSIAKAVMNEIKYIDSRRVKSQRAV